MGIIIGFAVTLRYSTVLMLFAGAGLITALF